MTTPAHDRVNVKLRDQDRAAIAAVRDALHSPFHAPLDACAILRAALHDFHGRVVAGQVTA